VAVCTQQLPFHQRVYGSTSDRGLCRENVCLRVCLLLCTGRSSESVASVHETVIEKAIKISTCCNRYNAIIRMTCRVICLPLGQGPSTALSVPYAPKTFKCTGRFGKPSTTQFLGGTHAHLRDGKRRRPGSAGVGVASGGGGFLGPPTALARGVGGIPRATESRALSHLSRQ
jgi:hypothetical protein